MRACPYCELYEAMKEGVRQRIADLEAENAKLRQYEYAFSALAAVCKEFNETDDKTDAFINVWMRLKEENAKLLEDSDRLGWYVKNSHMKVMGNEERGYVVWDQSNGLTKAGQGKTFREAIDASRKERS